MKNTEIPGHYRTWFGDGPDNDGTDLTEIEYSGPDDLVVIKDYDDHQIYFSPDTLNDMINTLIHFTNTVKFLRSNNEKHTSKNKNTKHKKNTKNLPKTDISHR